MSILRLYLKWVYHCHISKWYFGHAHDFVINHGCYMDEKLQWKKMTSFMLPHHHLLVECTTNTWLQLFHVEFEVTSYDYNQLYSHLGHLMIDFLVIKDIILSNEWKTM